MHDRLKFFREALTLPLEDQQTVKISCNRQTRSFLENCNTKRLKDRTNTNTNEKNTTAKV